MDRQRSSRRRCHARLDGAERRVGREGEQRRRDGAGEDAGVVERGEAAEDERAEAARALCEAGAPFARLLETPTFEIGLYKPVASDAQGPHARDELYIIARGSGDFACDGKTQKFIPGDAFFVPARLEHRFLNFSADFWTWVVFFGPRPVD